MSIKESSGAENIIKKLEELQNRKSSGRYWNISWLQGIILEGLAKSHRPKSILEIGTSNGFSTLWLAKGIFSDESAHITTIEVDPGRVNEARSNFQQAGVAERISIIGAEIFELLDSETLKGPFDMVFLDAAQKRYAELIDMLLQKKIIGEKTLLAADNILSHGDGEMLKSISERFETEIINVDDGLLVAWLK